MRKTIITHFYNEEYLLPWWLNHHKDKFDWGVCINYASTDRSVEIIHDICPGWVVVDSINEVFDARLCDEEVIKYERQIPGWKVTLNVTEFLIGDYSVLNNKPEQKLLIPCNIMVDVHNNQILSAHQSLVKEKTFGIPYYQTNVKRHTRRPRCIHNYQEINYPLGRHFENYNCEALQINWFGWAPFTPELIQRKLQIQNKIPNSDRIRGFGTEHFTTYEQIINEYTLLKDKSIDLNQGKKDE